MNKEEIRINNKCNFIDDLLLNNGLYEGISALVEIEEHISNLYDEIDNYKHQLEEKDKVIAEAIEYMNSLEFFDLMNSKTNTEYCPKDKAQCEDYFKAKEKLVSILQGKEVE